MKENRFIPLEVKINPKKNAYEVVPVDRGIVGHLCHAVG